MYRQIREPVHDWCVGYQSWTGSRADEKAKLYKAELGNKLARGRQRDAIREIKRRVYKSKA